MTARRKRHCTASTKRSSILGRRLRRTETAPLGLRQPCQTSSARGAGLHSSWRSCRCFVNGRKDLPVPLTVTTNGASGGATMAGRRKSPGADSKPGAADNRRRRRRTSDATSIGPRITDPADLLSVGLALGNLMRLRQAIRHCHCARRESQSRNGDQSSLPLHKILLTKKATNADARRRFKRMATFHVFERAFKRQIERTSFASNGAPANISNDHRATKSAR